MITERGTLKLTTAMDAKMQKELMKPAVIFALIMLIAGAVGVGAMLAWEIVSIFMETESNSVFGFLIVFAVILGLGIGLKLIINSAVKNISALPRINEYEFYSGHFTIDQTVNGENVLHNKILNNQITKSKETNNYLFFYIGTVVYPVSKDGVNESELNTLRAIFRLPVKGATVSLSEKEKTEGGGNELS